MTSPTKNQQMTSVVTSVFKQASLIVTFFQLRPFTILTRSLIALGISAGVGGLSSIKTPEAINLRTCSIAFCCSPLAAVNVDMFETMFIDAAAFS